MKDGLSLGRTFRDSPDIDNTVTINSQLKVGEFQNILIKDVSAYNMIGELAT